jgi:hypothetical protein
VIGDLQAGTPVAFEAALGAGWLVELLEEAGFQPHLVHPLQCKAITSAQAPPRDGRLRTAHGPYLCCDCGSCKGMVTLSWHDRLSDA